MSLENPEANPEQSAERGMALFERFKELLKPNDRVLDLGARDGVVGEILLHDKPSLSIVAVDKLSDEELRQEKVRAIRTHDPRMSWVIADIAEYIQALPADERFQAIFAQNIFQFLPKEIVLTQLIPRLQATLGADNPFALRVFSRDPEPAFPTPFDSYYSLTEITGLFPENSWAIDIAADYSYEALSLAKDMRRFHTVNLLARKK